MGLFGKDPTPATTISPRDAARFRATLRRQVQAAPEQALDANNRREQQRRRARLS